MKMMMMIVVLQKTPWNPGVTVYIPWIICIYIYTYIYIYIHIYIYKSVINPVNPKLGTNQSAAFKYLNIEY